MGEKLKIDSGIRMSINVRKLKLESGFNLKIAVYQVVLLILMATLILFPGAPVYAESNPGNYIFDISEGNITVSVGSSVGNLKVTYGAGEAQTTTADFANTQTITIIGSSTEHTVVVDLNSSSNLANITLNNANIAFIPPERGWSESGDCSFQIKNGAINLTLVGVNVITSPAGNPGLRLEGTNALTILGSGSLTATGGTFSAGIGGGNYKSGGKITVENGTVTAIGGTEGGAAIGGGYSASGGEIVINGGTVYATGGTRAAGIGGGYYGTGSAITINGGTVITSGGSFNGAGGAGIGGGCDGAVGTITISGGTVTATGGDSGAGIGGGSGGSGGTITITGGTIAAIGGDYGAGIGGGNGGVDGGTISLSNGTIVATGGYNGAGIGGGFSRTSGGVINISSPAAVTAFSGGNRPAIDASGGAIEAGSTAYVLMANFSATKSSGTVTGVYLKSDSSLKASATPAIGHKSVALTLPEADTYQLKTATILQQYGSPGVSNFVITAAGLNIFNDVVDCELATYTVTVNKDGSAWTNGTADIKLSTANDALTDSVSGTSSGGIFTFDNLNPGLTFYIWDVSKGQYTGQSLSNSSTSAILDYYTVTLTTGTGIASTSGSGIYLSGSAISINATVSDTYSWEKWAQISDGTLVSTDQNYTITSVSGPQSYTAEAKSTSDGDESNSSHVGKKTVIIVDGTDYAIGTERTNGNSTLATAEQIKLADGIAKAADGTSVIFPVSGNANVTVQLVVKNIEDMAQKDITLTIKTGYISYNLITTAIDTAQIKEAFGTTNTNDILFYANITNSNVVINGGTVIIPPVSYNITCTYRGKTIPVETFSSFVNRNVEITAEQAKQVTTAVVVETDGTLRHVPTKVIDINGKYYAVINSLTNSTYALIWHPIEFADAASNWAKDAINDLGSRMVVTGVRDNIYEPKREIGRGEFAAIMVRALGLDVGIGASTFADIKSSSWYSGYIDTAVSYGLISGYVDGTFHPNEKITREEAMVIIARGMIITKLNPNLTESEITSMLTGYKDNVSVAGWANANVAACLKVGIISGRTGTTLCPKENITRDEVAVIVKRLLQESGLI